MGKMSRTKGHSYEREIAKKLRKVFPSAKRHLEYQKEEASGVDIENSGNLRIQCKRLKTYAPISKIKEIKSSDGIHCLITKGDREKDVVCLYLEDFLKIIEDVGEVYECQETKG